VSNGPGSAGVCGRARSTCLHPRMIQKGGRLETLLRIEDEQLADELRRETMPGTGAASAVRRPCCE
jgi:hypothetical protein